MLNVLLLFSLRLPGYNKNYHYRNIVIANKNRIHNRTARTIQNVQCQLYTWHQTQMKRNSLSKQFVLIREFNTKC